MADSKQRSPPRSPRRSASNDAPPRRNRSRSRSRSPRRRRDNDRQGGGFRWKEKRRDDNTDRDARERRLERGYRNRSPRYDDRREERPKDKARKEKGETVVNSGTAAAEDRLNIASKFGNSVSSKNTDRDSESKDKVAAAAPAIAQQASAEPMIIVHVNDRLGTKAAIPCLASDSIRLFKAQVAARIGRQPHEILLKRQGERPFKDQLTLEDYGVSNGVQIDLEIDTGE